eukprot:GHVR01068038.1.p1 GENE.GHVR01068038.1~~GHVR01068038.1.p1  ORF type:complete len:189 (-),score=63.06 GHVR01068038.1:184-750(-)
MFVCVCVCVAVRDLGNIHLDDKSKHITRRAVTAVIYYRFYRFLPGTSKQVLILRSNYDSIPAVRVLKAYDPHTHTHTDTHTHTHTGGSSPAKGKKDELCRQVLLGVYTQEGQNVSVSYQEPQITPKYLVTAVHQLSHSEKGLWNNRLTWESLTQTPQNGSSTPVSLTITHDRYTQFLFKNVKSFEHLY